MISLTSGNLLILFSDGITEAMNADEEEFEEERLVKVVKENMDDQPEVLIDKIKTDQSFAGDEPRMDDMTIIVIKRV